MLKVEHLVKKYQKETAVNDITFEIGDSQICILLGPNGAGKSTIIKSAAGLLPHDGTITVNGLDTKTLEAKKIFAYIPEVPSLYTDLTIQEHMEFIAKAYDLDPDYYHREIDRLLDYFDLSGRKNSLGSELSKGMMQKTSICMALLIRPQVIFVDEPMVGLDPKAIKVLKKELIRLRDNGATILISTHMLEMVDDIWDSTIVISKGQVLGQFKKEDLKDEAINQLFFEVVEQGEEGDR